MIRARTALAVSIVLLASACGGGGGDDQSAASSDEPASAGPQVVDASATDLPAVDVIDIETGAQVNLQSLVPSNRPLLLWFWAPH